MPSNPTWADTVDDTPKWEETIEESPGVDVSKPISLDPYQQTHMQPRIGLPMDPLGPRDYGFAEEISRTLLPNVAGNPDASAQKLIGDYAMSPIRIASLPFNFIPHQVMDTVEGVASDVGNVPFLALGLNAPFEPGKPILPKLDMPEQDLPFGLNAPGEIYNQLSEMATPGNVALAGVAHKAGPAIDYARAKPPSIELARELQQSPLNVPPEGAIRAERQLGVQVPPNPFFNPGVRELASRAIEESQNRAVLEPGAEPALAKLRREVEPPILEQVINANKAEPLGGQVSFNAPAEAKAVPSVRQTATEVPDAIQQKATQPVRSVREQPVEVASEVPTKENSVKADAGGSEAAPKTEIDNFSAMDATTFDKAIKDTGIGLTSSAYRMAERLKTEDIPKLEAAEKKAHAQRKEASANAKTPEAFAQSMAYGMKGQMFREAIKWRQALDEARANRTTMTEDFAALERKHGVGESDRFGGDLRAALERETKADIDKYNDLSAQRNALIEADKGFTPEDVALWKELEGIKNKYGGMPPETASTAIPVEQLKAGPRPLTEAEKKQLNPKRFAAEKESKAPEIEPVLEVESVKSLDPASGTPLSATDSLINKLEGLKFAEANTGRLYSLPHPEAIAQVGKTAWNNGIDVAISAVKAGKQIKEAVDEAINYIKREAKGFDETKVRANLQNLLEKEAKPVGPTSAALESENVRMRNLSARGTQAESVPAAVQEKIGQAPESFYQQQSMKKVVDSVKGLSDSELSSVGQDSPVYTAAKLEQANRLFDAGKNEAGYQVFQDLSQNLTRLGQVINQAKLLNGLNPENIVKVTNESLRNAGKDPLTVSQAKELSDLSKKRLDAERALDKATDEWVKNPTEENAKKAQEQYDQTTQADLALQKKAHTYDVTTWPGMLKAFAQGNPLTPISNVANFLGNTLGSAMEASSRTVAAQLDTIRSALTGRERQIKVQPLRGPIEAGKGYVQGLKEAPGILFKGRGDIVKGEVSKGLQPLRALAKAFARNPEGPTVGGKVPFNERVRLAIEGTFGIAPETMLRVLSATDRPAYLSARSRLIAEQLGLTKVPKDKWSMAQKFPELFFDEKTVSRINTEAADAVFQAPSKAVNYLQALINEKLGPWGDLAFTLAVSPYKLTPWNLVKRTLQYNPLVAAAESAFNAAKGNTRKAELAAGRMVVGGIIYTAGYFLYKNGLVGPSLDTRDESQKARLLSGEVLPPNHVNVSGLKRLIKGGDPSLKPGDETYDLTRGGGAVGAILTSVANIGREFERQPEESGNFAEQLALHSTLQQASFTVNQSFLKGVTGLLDAVQDRNIGPYMNGVENMVLNVATPNTLSTLSRATREYQPDFSADGFKKQVENVVRNRFGFAGLDDFLPLKRGLWGEPLKQTPDGANPLFYHFFDISKGKQVTDDPVSLELYQLWRKTGDSTVIPSLPGKEFTLAKTTYQLTPEQRSRYAELVGKSRREIVDMMVKNPEWQKVSEEARIKLLNMAYDRGQDFGKGKFFMETQGLKTKPERAGFK